MFTCIWAFEVAAEAEAEFLRHYGPDGSWAALFRRDPAYVETRLLRDRDQPGRFLTMDIWRSAEHYRAFLQAHAGAYQALDRECEALSRSETALGSYTVVETA